MAQKFGNGRWVLEGFLDNRVEGTVVGRVVFAAIGPVDVYLAGNFKPDIAGEVIRFRNGRFGDDEMAAQVIGDMDNPQIGKVNLISFDPHPFNEAPPARWFTGGRLDAGSRQRERRKIFLACRCNVAPQAASIQPSLAWCW